MILLFCPFACCFFILFAGAKSVSIQSFIDERKCETVVEKSSPEVQQQIPNLNEASPFVSGVVSVGGFHNPVVLSSSSPAPKVCDEVLYTSYLVLLLFCLIFA